MITLFKNAIDTALKHSPEYRQLVDRLRTDGFPIDVAGPKGSFGAILISKLHRLRNGVTLVVVPTETEAKDFIRDVALFGIEALEFPWWGAVPYGEIPQSSPIYGRRVHVLNQLLQNRGSTMVVTPLRALLHPLPPRDYLAERTFSLSVGEEIDPVAISEELTRFGYSRTPQVGVRGEYALRGEVLDVFVPGDEYASRVVFEYDRIEAIRQFDPATQASVKKMKSRAIHAVKEVIWDDDRVSSLADRIIDAPEMAGGSEAILDALQTGRHVPGEQAFFPLSFDAPATLLEYLGEEATVFLTESERLVSAAESLAKEYAGIFRERRREGSIPRPERVLFAFEDVLKRDTRRVSFHVLREEDNDSSIRFAIDPPRSFFGNLDFLKEELGRFGEAEYQTFVFADSQSQADRIRHILAEFDIEVLPAAISGGFALPDAKLLVIEENEIFGRRKRVPRSVHKAQSQAIDTFVDLNPGDHVVHVNYGIGRFKGIERIKAAGNERDYIHLEYASEEFIYIPIEQVNLIQRYIGHGGSAPRLDKIGGKSWQNRKNRVKKSVEDLADRLVKLYSKRKRTSGYAFPTDTEWQLEFESTFPYEETEDQLTCIEDVKRDMEAPQPMDRLICGDVGYGKTEVALRAAFKAVSAGKQVAFLAPTTILVEQHYENIEERIGRFPVTPAMLSRFVGKSEQKTVLKGLADGSIDIVVGTHRLLQKDVKFRNLGLLIVDEEQRFGVKDKERLKELKTSVDSLAMTATPIPRTLHMSLLKIRDMSVLNTPPHNRLPIETVIQEFSEELVAEAVRKEVDRGGQVYYLHNRIETLDNVVLFLKSLLPDVGIELAHGQMSSQDLEDIMHRFIHGGFEVLVATTIIENGIDIPNVNTIIIDRADMYGIGQLYQLRGRVGRSEKLAYAYLFYPEQRALSEIAMKRLQVISDYTELGSGFKVALKDLEVRGAGNLLGREQSGDILSVGFDMYIRLLDQAISELERSDTETEEPPEVYLELEYSGYIPDSYIEEPTEKMEVYKRIASVSTEEELEIVFGELEDRFGPLPEEVHSLLSLAEIRIICRRLFVSTLKERKGTVEIEFAKIAKVSVDRILEMIRSSNGKIRLDPKRPHVLLMDTGAVGLKEKSEFIRGRLSALL